MHVVYLGFDVFMQMNAINVSAVCVALGNSADWCLAHPPAVFERSSRLFAMHVYFENDPLSLVSGGASDASVLLRTFAELEDENFIAVLSSEFPATALVTYMWVTLIYLVLVLFMAVVWWLKLDSSNNKQKI